MDARDRPRRDRSRPNLGVAKLAKNFTKPRQRFRQERSNGIVGGIARGNAGAPVEQNSLNIRIRRQSLNQGSNLRGFVFNNLIVTHPMTRRCDPGLHQLATFIGAGRAGIAHGQHCAGDH